RGSAPPSFRAPRPTVWRTCRRRWRRRPQAIPGWQRQTRRGSAPSPLLLLRLFGRLGFLVAIAPAEPAAPAAAFSRFAVMAGLVRGREAGDEGVALRIRAVGIGGVGSDYPLPVEALVGNVQRCARQALEDRRPHPHRAGRAVQAGGLVLVVADPDDGEMVAGPAGEPAVAAVVAGAGLAGGVQMAKAVGHKLPAGAGRH